MTRLLLVEDDPQMLRALSLTLAARGFEVVGAATGADALAAATRQDIDAIVLDLGLPDMDGIDVLRQVRQTDRVPVLVLSARSDRFEKVRALDSGADDYVTKPFDVEELLARVRAAVRRATPDIGAPVVRTDHFVVDMARKEVRSTEGTTVHLTPTEWSLLEVLARQPGMVVRGQDLLKEVWGPAYGAETNYLRVYMAGLRKKLEPDPAHPRYLLTSPGIGYRLEGIQQTG
jgi:two-component system KDP operon response regulator KdpE